MKLNLRTRPAIAALGAALALTALTGTPATAAPATATGVPSGCGSFSTQVAMTAGTPADQRISGLLCEPRAPRGGTVQLLLHGGTYDHTYWTMRGDSGKPSYVEAAVKAGNAVLAVDRLGTGRSSAPHSSTYATDTNEVVTHQIVKLLRDRGYAKVILVGNSFGATSARMTAVQYPGDVDGLILTGEGGYPNYATFGAMADLWTTADQHPLLAHRGLDSGYTALRTGSKAPWFYDPRTTDPKVTEYDEATTEPGVYPADPMHGDVSYSKQIRVPVLVVLGENDKLLCGEGASDCSDSAALKASIGPLYAPEARLETKVVPDTGHVLNLHRTTDQWYGLAQDWARRL
ncbi:alpha/beta hydrolase [Streptomyces sp. NPDC012888]|uniref:alpha/beta hydrolase n=1 Tax=Streptomyces sp. NPDC012888 TaxID=3364855 RepID=UPI00367B3664